MRKIYLYAGIVAAASLFANVGYAQELEIAESPSDRYEAKENFNYYPALTDEWKIELGISPSAKRPVVIDFWATWCMPCLEFAPTYEAYMKAYRGKVDMVKCNVDEHRGIMSNYGVKSIPNVLLFDADGKPFKRYTGRPSDEQFTADLDALSLSGISEIGMEMETAGDDVYYSIDGREVKNPGKGIYIRGGKKVVIK